MSSGGNGRPRLPVWALILDLVGTLLVALGLYGMFAEGDLPFADVVDLRGIAVALIVIGVLLMLPLVLAAVTKLRG